MMRSLDGSPSEVSSLEAGQFEVSLEVDLTEVVPLAGGSLGVGSLDMDRLEGSA